MANFIAYYRVSTAEQGASGLGLKAQQEAVKRHIGQGTLLKKYTEVETGKGDGNNRPNLQQAIAHAKRSKAILVVAKMDRLARDVHFTSGLMKSGVEFVACDNPNANKLTIHILAAVAEDEAEKISRHERCSGRIEGGFKLGSARPECADNLTPEAAAAGRKKGQQAMRVKAMEAVADLLPRVRTMRSEGNTLQQIAEVLNDEGHTTRNGAKWTPTQLHRVLARAEHRI